ncbi:hypothetical protein SP99_04567 [Enterobacter sp. BIDMC92]|uniref:DUF1254 domain-containing protein n=1 Tax=Enterobacter sp. BIDMC92 TaxID=1594172 RepID=UPI00065A6082|nr:DUF1254 domain-containing protein [Enterobacter sp. BIDMC92]KLW85405.1 hypothetical protein SP99_04567 [Enterobacter sp. BIDMC92]
MRNFLHFCISGMLFMSPNFVQASDEATTGSSVSDSLYNIASTLSAEDAYAIALDAYVYLYPIITMDVTRINQTSSESAGGAKGPANQFHHLRKYPDPSFNDVVRPNFDTLYSQAWLDLTHGPQVISAPNTHGRYYLLPMLDMWSNVFAVPGARTTGTESGKWLVVPPGWRGVLPSGIDVIQAPTPYVWVLGRTQVNGPDDYAAVHKIQDGFSITPLSMDKVPDDKSIITTATQNLWVKNNVPPLLQVNQMNARDYFSYGSELLNAIPPQLTDWSILIRMKRLGIYPGVNFNFDSLSPEVQSALERAVHDGLSEIKKYGSSTVPKANGWFMSTNATGTYGNNYLTRAFITMVGLGANLDTDAVYSILYQDANGQAMDGKKKYVLHFAKGQTPPTNAFWSVTMYNSDGFAVDNPLHRYAISSWMPLKQEIDGSTNIYIQSNSPGKEKESNWLPSPSSGKTGVTMRIYWPKSSVENGNWIPPVVIPVQ